MKNLAVIEPLGRPITGFDARAVTHGAIAWPGKRGHITVAVSAASIRPLLCHGNAAVSVAGAVHRQESNCDTLSASVADNLDPMHCTLDTVRQLRRTRSHQEFPKGDLDDPRKQNGHRDRRRNPYV
ncbi:MAG: hypothetical protein JO033_02045 [Acidobacteriaceae bacterium]|nr:hypothetical protein [Acidobacteriaceae bacterium]MBV9502834.1 hypothetical protein [Acidobacteriaceae bacterium]